MNCRYFNGKKWSNCLVEQKQKNVYESEDEDDALVILIKTLLENSKNKSDKPEDNTYDKLRKKILDSDVVDDLIDGERYDQEIRNINFEQLSGERTIERLQQVRLERLAYAQNVLSINQRHNNGRYNTLFKQISEEDDVNKLNDGEYYDVEILKLNENYLTGDRSLQKIQQARLDRRLYIEIRDGIDDETNNIQLDNNGYWDRVIDDSNLSNDYKRRLHSFRRERFQRNERFYDFK